MNHTTEKRRRPSLAPFSKVSRQAFGRFHCGLPAKPRQLLTEKTMQRERENLMESTNPQCDKSWRRSLMARKCRSTLLDELTTATSNSKCKSKLCRRRESGERLKCLFVLLVSQRSGCSSRDFRLAENGISEIFHEMRWRHHRRQTLRTRRKISLYICHISQSNRRRRLDSLIDSFFLLLVKTVCDVLNWIQPECVMQKDAAWDDESTLVSLESKRRTSRRRNRIRPFVSSLLHYRVHYSTV